MEKVTAIITCQDREDEIEACLRSVRWVDELIVVDSFSSDRTPALAKKWADRFYQREYLSPGEQKNWAMGRASHGWILVIDSDEVIPEALAREVRRELASPAHGCYRVRRQAIFLGRKMRFGAWGSDSNYFLFRRGRYKYTEEVHEILLPKDKCGCFREPLIHYTHRSLEEFVGKSHRYAAASAEKYYLRGRRGYAARALFHPLFNFIWNYCFRLGFLDGSRGLISAVLSSAYVAEKYARLWELTGTARKINGDKPQ
ncbi:MAG: glycosyltransferase family 2 protein [Candidatus Erginobacter occultus]|nr:glycosyltransferase family 2 protein [Candidatus Erginobacter occultus]